VFGPLFKRILWVLLLGLVATWIQGAVVRSFVSDYGVVPNLILIIVVYLAFHEVNSFGAFLAFLVGFEFDLFSGIRLGPWAGSCVLVFGLLACFAQRMFVESALATVVAVFFSSLAASIVYLLCTYELHPLTSGRVLIILVEALFSAVLAPVVFRVLRVAIPRREQMVIGHLN
jgi:rod shape-determining protein MreD